MSAHQSVGWLVLYEGTRAEFRPLRKRLEALVILSFTRERDLGLNRVRVLNAQTAPATGGSHQEVRMSTSPRCETAVSKRLEMLESECANPRARYSNVRRVPCTVRVDLRANAPDVREAELKRPSTGQRYTAHGCQMSPNLMRGVIFLAHLASRLGWMPNEPLWKQNEPAHLASRLGWQPNEPRLGRKRWPDRAHPCAGVSSRLDRAWALRHDFVLEPLERPTALLDAVWGKIRRSGASPPHA